jgi:hypothetical protein
MLRSNPVLLGALRFLVRQGENLARPLGESFHASHKNASYE